MSTRSASPALADAANVLSEALKVRVQQLGKTVRPRLNSLEARFVAVLQSLGLAPRQRTALSAITPGAAFRLLGRGRRIEVFLEQVEYNGRRLAKLNLPPSDITGALAEYDRLLSEELRKLAPSEYKEYQWVREQLQFCILLTLNRAYYQVRETEAQAFYELFRAELEARTLEELLERSLLVLRRFCEATEAALFLLDEENGQWVMQAQLGAEGHRLRNGIGPVTTRVVRKRQLLKPRCIHVSTSSRAPLLDSRWKERFPSAWSVPLIADGRLTGVMQFAFDKRYEWLAREQELLEAAAERCTVAAEKAKLVEDLAAREEQVRRLAEHMLHVEEEERRRISRELHDEAGQSLLYIRLRLEMLQRNMDEKSALHGEIGDIRKITEHTILEMRRLIAALSPAVLQQLGLGAALRRLLSRFRQLHSCQVRLGLSPLDRLPKRVETIVYRLVQECLNNIAKHSKASNVNISLTSADGVLRLVVEDDGVGFLVSEALAKSNSFGLAGMRERVTLLGGNFEVTSERIRGRKKRRGTRVTAELPIPEAI